MYNENKWKSSTVKAKYWFFVQIIEVRSTRDIIFFTLSSESLSSMFVARHDKTLFERLSVRFSVTNRSIGESQQFSENLPKSHFYFEHSGDFSVAFWINAKHFRINAKKIRLQRCEPYDIFLFKMSATISNSKYVIIKKLKITFSNAYTIGRCKRRPWFETRIACYKQISTYTTSIRKQLSKKRFLEMQKDCFFNFLH